MFLYSCDEGTWVRVPLLPQRNTRHWGLGFITGKATDAIEHHGFLKEFYPCEGGGSLGSHKMLLSMILLGIIILVVLVILVCIGIVHLAYHWAVEDITQQVKEEIERQRMEAERDIMDGLENW